MDRAEEMSDRRGIFFLEMHCNAGRRKEINGKEAAEETERSIFCRTCSKLELDC